MEYIPSFRDSLHADVKPSYLAHTMTEEEFEAKKFGLPKLKKYPMPDVAHVRSAIKFFNYVTPAHEKELARNILARMDEYGMDPDGLSFEIGDNNRFKKYITRSASLKHHGIKGMHWGVRRYQNPDGSLTDAGRKHYAVRESKGTFFDKNRTWLDSDLKKANGKGGYSNRIAVAKQIETAIKADKNVQAAERDCRATTRQAYSSYAELYNKHAADQGVSQRLNPKTFNWYNQMGRLDNDVDEAVWSDRSNTATRMYKAIDQHESSFDRLIDSRNAVANRYAKQYNDAVLRDIPHDGSKQAINRILKRYGVDKIDFGPDIGNSNRNDPEFGWEIYTLFDA